MKELTGALEPLSNMAVVGALFDLGHMNADAAIIFTEDDEVKLIFYRVGHRSRMRKNDGQS